MDMRSWKKVLLQWITECGFSERNYFNIEQSDIDIFYQQFRMRFHTGDSVSNVEQNNLTDFLHVHYPSFKPHLDDENALSSSEYIYVYSLLLHYSCVKYPQAYFHEICQKLSAQAQQCIACFFKELLNCASLNKETLRHAIANVATAYCNTLSQQESNNNSSDATNTSSFTRQEASPMKTPNRNANVQRISPSTPKSFMLEERTRELYNLRAQLETERYEKGLLEVQIKQNEDKILKLNQDHKKLQQQIQDLKTDILTKNTHGSPKGGADKEQVKRRLCKQIAQKEQEIIKLTDLLNTQKEEKNLIQEKLLYAERQIIVCMERIKELDYKVDELTSELEQKNEAIKYLHDNKLELEQYITETRFASSSSKPDFNTSAECLDMSFSRVASSSSSQGSPENLGCSVVDVQLREKESENKKLKEQISSMSLNNTRLAKLIQQLSFKLSEEYQLHLEMPQQEENTEVDLTEYLMMYADCAERLGKSYKNEKNLIKKLQEESEAVQQRNVELNYDIEQLEMQMNTLRERLQRTEEINDDMESNKCDLLEKVKELETATKTLGEQKYRLITQLDSLTNEYDQHKMKCKSQQLDFQFMVENLKTEITARDKELGELLTKSEELEKSHNGKNQIYEQLQEETQSWKSKFEELQERYLLAASEHENELKMYSEKSAKQKCELKDHQTASQLVKEKYEKILVQYEDMKQQTRETAEHLSAMRNQLHVKEKEMGQLGEEIDKVRELNVELEERVNKLITQMKLEKQNSEHIVKLKEESIEKSNAEKQHLTALLLETQDKLKSAQTDAQKFQRELEAIYCTVEQMCTQLDNPIDLQSALSINLTQIVQKINQQLTKIEHLEDGNLEYSTKLQTTEVQLQEAQKQIQIFESKISCLQKESSSQKEEYGLALTKYENELKQSQERHSSLERELLIVIEEHNQTKHKLEFLQQRYTDSIQSLESKLDHFAADNFNYLTDINNIKSEHATTELRFKEADDALNELADQLEVENKEREDLRVKLKTNTDLLQVAEKKLESILIANVGTMRELQIALEKQTERLLTAEEQVARLEGLRVEHMELIVDLENDIKQITEGKERMLADSAKFAARLQREQVEKAQLLKSLENTADQLKNTLAESEEQIAEFECKLKLVDDQKKDLQRTLDEKEYDIVTARDSYQLERHNWESKISELMRNLTEQSIELEAKDIAIADIVSILENNPVFLSADKQPHEKKIFFTVDNQRANCSTNQLKKALNRLINEVNKITWQLEEKEATLKQITREVATTKEENDKLNKAIASNRSEIADLHIKLNSDAKGKEVERLQVDLENLEQINSKLATENEALQLKLSKLEQLIESTKCGLDLVNEEKTQLATEQSRNTSIIEKLKQEEQSLNQTLLEKQNEIEKLQERISNIEKQLKKKSTKLTSAEKDLEAAIDRLNKAESKVHQLEKSLLSVKNELRELNDKNRLQQTSNQTLETELAQKSKEISRLQSKLADEVDLQQQLEKDLRSTSQKLDESIAAKLTSENKYEQLNSNFQQLIRDYDISKLQLQSSLVDVERLTAEVETHKVDKVQLTEELKENKRELQSSNNNVSELIQQISSIRQEKESFMEENHLLRKQLEDNGKSHDVSESKLKSIIECSQSLERKLLGTENELKSIRALLEKSEQSSEKYAVENQKLRDNQESLNKRIEKLALKLGEAQARASKVEREHEKLTKLHEAKSTANEAMQREQDLLQNELKTLKERFAKAEKTNEQLSGEVSALEKNNNALEEAKFKLEHSEIDLKSKIVKLEKMRETNEEKLRKLNNTINNTEHTNVRLNLEIGALNSQLAELKQTANAEHLNQLEEINRNLSDAQSLAKQFEEQSKQLQVEAAALLEQNTAASEQLAKVSAAQKNAEDKCESLSRELEQARIDLSALRVQKVEVEEAHIDTCSKLNDYEALNEQLAKEKQQLAVEQQARISQLEAQLSTKVGELSDLRIEIETLHSRLARNCSEEVAAVRNELEELRKRVAFADSMLEKEQTAATQLRLDNQILQAKYRESKQRALDECKNSEERIKENRLELEGKLEKMKSKMKTLYTEEMTKMKAKQEREIASVKSEMEVLLKQNAKYEEHTRKLSNQIVRLNDRILEQQKQNAILTTKLKHLEEFDTNSFKRPFSMHSASGPSSLTSAGPVPSSNLGSNLAMEDEEGEVFNNTYLTDLKTGRMSDWMSADEIRHRNSMVPPHLKSAYAVQYTDHELAEDELRDGPHSLDDSLSVLLSTTGGNVARKKVSGATHYKRPGPPTPSKNGGRLSFGSAEPPREILRETNDANGLAVSSSKTPARFGFFSSRFSMGNTKDENSPPRRRLSNMFKKK